MPGQLLPRMQCQLATLGLIGSFIAKVAPEVLPPAARPPSPVPTPAPANPCFASDLPLPPAVGVPQLNRKTLASLQAAVEQLEAGLLTVLVFLQRNQSFQALVASLMNARHLGWGWNKPALGLAESRYKTCWDQIAVLRGMASLPDHEKKHVVLSKFSCTMPVLFLACFENPNLACRHRLSSQPRPRLRKAFFEGAGASV